VIGKFTLGIYANAVNKAVVDIESTSITRRLWNKDGLTHNPTIKAIENRLGWLDVLDNKY
jgi:hypothetical protein